MSCKVWISSSRRGATYFIGSAHAQMDASSALQAAHHRIEDTRCGSILYENLCPGTYVAPEDFGELHEIFAVVDGEEVARGGFRIKLAASIGPAEGPVGTPVTVTVTGMAARLFSGATLALRYDNAYTGVLTATTTRGTARAEFRAAGPVGQHVVIINAGSVPAYLNIAQSPYAFVYEHIPTQEDFRLPFRVTADQGPPANSVAWPLPERVQPPPANAMRTTASGAGSPHVQ